MYRVLEAWGAFPISQSGPAHFKCPVASIMECVALGVLSIGLPVLCMRKLRPPVTHQGHHPAPAPGSCPLPGHHFGLCDFLGSDPQCFHKANAPLLLARVAPAACAQGNVWRGSAPEQGGAAVQAAWVLGGAMWSRACLVPEAPTRGQPRVRNAACQGLCWGP